MKDLVGVGVQESRDLLRGYGDMLPQKKLAKGDLSLYPPCLAPMPMNNSIGSRMETCGTNFLWFIETN